VEWHIVTAFPKFYSSPLDQSILRRALERELITVSLYDIRDFTTDKHKQIDDYPYGGGPGMVMKPEPLHRCLEQLYEQNELDGVPVTYLTPDGDPYDQKKAIELSLREKVVLLCGHYKGIDERVRRSWVGEEISVGDYVLTGGEAASLVLIDSAVRLLPGAISDIDSAETDSFHSGLLDHPHYTRPERFRGMAVPKILLSGNHAEIAKWRKTCALERTRERRKDLYEKYIESENDILGEQEV